MHGGSSMIEPMVVILALPAGVFGWAMFQMRRLDAEAAVAPAPSEN